MIPLYCRIAKEPILHVYYTFINYICILTFCKHVKTISFIDEKEQFYAPKRLHVDGRRQVINIYMCVYIIPIQSACIIYRHLSCEELERELLNL